MRRYFFLLPFLSFLSLAAHADPPKLSWGVKAGTNFNRIDDFYLNKKTKTGFYAGGLVEYRIKPTFAVLGELYFSRQWGELYQVDIAPWVEKDDFSYPLPLGFAQRRITSKIDYLYLPLGVRAYPLRWLSAECGIQFGYKIKVTDNVVTEVYDYNAPDRIYPVERLDYLVSSGSEVFNKPFDCDLFAGLSFHITPNIAVSGRYFLGFTNFMNSKNNTMHFKSKTYSVFQTGIEVKF